MSKANDPSATPMPGGGGSSAPIQNRPMVYVCGSCHKENEIKQKDPIRCIVIYLIFSYSLHSPISSQDLLKLTLIFVIGFFHIQFIFIFYYRLTVGNYFKLRIN
jgi:hypothetical protein